MSGLWYNASTPAYSEKKSKSIIHPFSVKGYTGLAINPYQGCQHRCAYCYATYEWSPEFYDRIYAKSNAPQVLDRQLASWKGDTIDPVMVASATDAYQPAELKYGLTRECIKVLQRHNVPYYVFTKSVIIERDLELHRGYRDNCFIVWSVTTCSEKVRRIIEPGTPPARRIFQAISKFAEAGVRCGVNVDPIMPLVTDGRQELEEIVESCRRAGVGHVFGAMLRLRDDIWERMKAALALLQVPDGAAQYMRLYNFSEPFAAGNNSNYAACDKRYAEGILEELAKMVDEKGMSTDFPAYMGSRKIVKVPGQTTLCNFA
ncbi:radical SAM protein [Nitrososphaera sp.]|uniref:SPL family radical SAM protein n=1 Tax=Nitrososphaera sp. TaxID=1971748 RepID=UPI00307DB94B